MEKYRIILPFSLLIAILAVSTSSIFIRFAQAFVAMGPLWVALLSPTLLNEKLIGAAILGLVIALIGGTIIGLSDACVIQNELFNWLLKCLSAIMVTVTTLSESIGSARL